MRKTVLLVSLVALCPVVSVAQQTTEQQIAQAVSPLPGPMRQGATVKAFTGEGLKAIRRGNNNMVCLADDPAVTGFHVACYHEDLKSFMARGRELRAEGKDGNESRAIRFDEIDAGELDWPTQPRSLYSLSYEHANGFDYNAGTIPGAWSLQVVYVPYASEQSIGVTTSPARDRPWLMHPGTPGAHLMISVPPSQRDK